MSYLWRKGRLWPLSRSDYDDNIEARGFIGSGACRTAIVTYGALYAVVALNFFAQALAECDGTLLALGIKASSLVPAMVTAEGIINCILSPFFGGFADVTPHRKFAFLITFVILMLAQVIQTIAFLPGERTRPDPNFPSFLLPEPLLKEDAVLFIAVAVYSISTIAYELNSLLVSAYAPELTTDEKVQHGYISDGYALGNLTQLLYALVVTGIVLAMGLGPFTSALVAGILSMVICISLFLYGYPKLGARKNVNPDLNKQCLGAVHILTEIASGVRKYPDLYIFMLSWAPLSASSSSSISLATSYLQFYLGLSSIEIQGLLALSLVMTVPGSILSRVLLQTFKVPVKKLYMAASFIQGTSFILAPLILSVEPVASLPNATLSTFGRCDDPIPNLVIPTRAAPGIFYVTGAFVMLWGVLLGVVFPVNTALFALLIPGGKETTYFGIKVTFSKILNFLPGLLFTIINETGSLQWTIAPLGAMSISSSLIAFFINMERGKTKIEDTLDKRRGAGKPEMSKDDQIDVI